MEKSSVDAGNANEWLADARSTALTNDFRCMSAAVRAVTIDVRWSRKTRQGRYKCSNAD